MGPEGKTFSVFCEQCGGALPVDLELGEVRCPFCSHRQGIDAEALARAREHVARLDQLRHEARFHADAAEGFRRHMRGGRGFAWAIGINVFLVGGAWSWAVTREALCAALGSLWGNVLMLPVTALGLVLLLLFARVIWHRTGAPASLTPVEVCQARCAGCGASVPVIVGHKLGCPFCEAELLADRDVVQRVEQAGSDEVRELERQASLAREEHVARIEQATRRGTFVGRLFFGFLLGTFGGTLLGGLIGHALGGSWEAGMLPGNVAGIIVGVAVAYLTGRRRRGT